MNTTLLRAGALSCALLASTALTTTASGQGLSIPPRQDATSPGGVSYMSGNFTHHVRDLSIGGDFPAGLTLERTYISNVGYNSLGSIGWIHNWTGRISLEAVKMDPGSPLTGQRQPYVYNVSVGSRSVGFLGGSHFSGGPPIVPTGQPQGTYTPVSPTGATLEYTGTSPANGHYIFTDSDGSVINFPDGSQPQIITDWTLPDGTRLDFTYDSGGLKSVISSRGYALLFDAPTSSGDRKICAVNMARQYVTATSTCPSGAQSVTYSYTAASGNPYLPLLTGATDANGQTTSYGYYGSGAFGSPTRVNCITPPGQSSCQVHNDYTLCEEWDEATQTWHGASAYVTGQQAATGESYAYDYLFPSSGEPKNDKCEGTISAGTTMTVNGTATTTVTPSGTPSGAPANQPSSITDPLNRTTSLEYMAGPPSLGAELGELTGVTRPLGNSTVNGYDDRGNITSQTRNAVPGSGLAAQTAAATFPASCTSTTRRTCNRPTSVTDFNGNATDYTYDNAHGGVLTETGPAVNGVRPQTRHSYAQRYAWLAASGGGFAQAATPVWVRTSSSTCRTSAASTTSPYAPCSAAGDEVRTEYDYGTGDSSHGNNLQLRGQTVTSTDPDPTTGTPVTTTLRTCFSYDAQGNRISQTSPNANLTSCP